MKKMALVQAPATEDPEENLRVLELFSRQARDAGCCCVCFPEGFLTGYAPQYSDRRGISLNGPVADRVSRLAQTLGTDILAGFMESDRGAQYLSQGIFLADGSRLCRRKTHLGEKERRFFSPGDALEPVTLSCGIKAGIQMCVETHFPEITQTLSLKGARVIFAPHAVPRKAGSREAVWNRMIPCRSYDSRVVMACCNLWDGDIFGGGCLVADETGTVTASCFENRPEMLVFRLNTENLERYRTGNPSPRYRYFPEHRRPELYR